ncbi:hypothetical protein CGRA01v4_14512 [Colletotrichum graminicola]|nr:hypothetical protein CGRA01v4_14512 [Colletotrichum graminicola]
MPNETGCFLCLRCVSVEGSARRSWACDSGRGTGTEWGRCGDILPTGHGIGPFGR